MGFSMLRDPPPGFMLERIRRLHRDGLPTTNLERNIRWLVSGEGRPVGCPDGHREDRFLEQLESMRLAAVEGFADLMLSNGERSIFDEFQARLTEGVEHLNHVDEIEFNNTLSYHFEQNQEDHALMRWLLEAEFLETENAGVVNTEPNRTLVDGLNGVVVKGLPLHISSAWTPYGRGGPGTMGPAARLLCYWTRGEYLGSCSISEFLDDATQHSQFEVRHKATSPHPLEDDGVIARPLRRRIRMHALAKIEIFTMITHGNLAERWVLRDSSAERYQHGLSETLMPGENFVQCAQRGLIEELGIEASRVTDSLVAYGSTRVEWGGGNERFDSRSMSGLPSMMCINPFYVEFDSNTDQDLVQVNQDGIPTRQFPIPDAGLNTTLNWVPDPSGLNVDESIESYSGDGPLLYHRWYALNYPDLPSAQEVLEQHRLITAIIGTTLLHHHRTDSPPVLIGPNYGGLLYEDRIWNRNATKYGLGVTSFESTPLHNLIHALIENGIIQAWSKNTCKLYLSSLGRLLHPQIYGQLSIQSFIEQIVEARQEIGLSDFDSTSVRKLLPWVPPVRLNEAEVERRLATWHERLWRLFHLLTDGANWRWFDGTIEALLRNQPSFEGSRTVILFKMFEDGGFDVKFQKNVNLPPAQLHSELLNHLRNRNTGERENEYLDETTLDAIQGIVNQLRRLNAMVVRLQLDE